VGGDLLLGVSVFEEEDDLAHVLGLALEEQLSRLCAGPGLTRLTLPGRQQQPAVGPILQGLVAAEVTFLLVQELLLHLVDLVERHALQESDQVHCCHGLLAGDHLLEEGPPRLLPYIIAVEHPPERLT
jgi:hypothetical protein